MAVTSFSRITHPAMLQKKKQKTKIAQKKVWGTWQRVELASDFSQIPIQSSNCGMFWAIRSNPSRLQTNNLQGLKNLLLICWRQIQYHSTPCGAHAFDGSKLFLRHKDDVRNTKGVVLLFWLIGERITPTIRSKVVIMLGPIDVYIQKKKNIFILSEIWIILPSTFFPPTWTTYKRNSHSSKIIN